MSPRRWLPHPLLSLFLVVLWLLLVNDFSFGQLVLAAILGWSIPLLSRLFWINPPIIARPWQLCRFLLLVVGDIIVANLQVARLVLNPLTQPKPAFVEVPLDLTDELALTMLASIICLTPGTVSADLSDDRRTLLLHCLDVDDIDELVLQIKERYERPLLEVFACSLT